MWHFRQDQFAAPGNDAVIKSVSSRFIDSSWSASTIHTVPQFPSTVHAEVVLGRPPLLDVGDELFELTGIGELRVFGGGAAVHSVKSGLRLSPRTGRSCIKQSRPLYR
jgi:hypothetical protein